MKLMCLSLSIFLLFGLAKAAEQQAPALAGFAAAYEDQCHKDHAERLKRLVAAGRKLTAMDKLNNDSLEQTKCQCMAGKLRDVSNGELARGILDRDSRAAGPFYERAFEECVVKSSRETVLPLCLLDAKKKPNSAHAAAVCKCMAAGYQQLDDQTLIDESRAVFKNSTQRAKDPNVALFHGKVAEVEDRCNKSTGR